MHYKQINAKSVKKKKRKKRVKNMSCMFRPGFLSALSVYSCCLVSRVSVWMSGAPLVCHDLLMRKPDSEIVMRVLITHDSYIVLHFQLITWEHCCLSTTTLHSIQPTTKTHFFLHLIWCQKAKMHSFVFVSSTSVTKSIREKQKIEKGRQHSPECTSGPVCFGVCVSHLYLCG